MYQCFRYINANGGSIFTPDGKHSALGNIDAVTALQFLSDKAQSE